MSAYSSLVNIFHKIGVLGQVSGVLGWDQAVMLPLGCAETRGEQLAVLGEMQHNMLVNQEVFDLIVRATAEELGEWDAANLRLMRRDYNLAAAVPAELLMAFTKATTLSEMSWRDARRNNDYKAFLPAFTEVVKLTQEIAQARAAHLNCAPYDALMEGFNNGIRQADIDPVFADLAAFLPEFIPQAIAKQAGQEGGVTLAMPVVQQRQLARKIAGDLGFNYMCGRLDVSTHPMCGGYSLDVRMTNRYDESNFLPAIMGVVHETGHAIYEQQRPLEWSTQPVGSHLGMAVHESQSLFVEMQLGRRLEFCQYLTTALKEYDYQVEPQQLYRLQNQVKPGFIRVDADELTYPLHVIMRYQLEKALLSGDLQPQDLPTVWNEKMQQMLGICPATDSEGCLQDIHWPSGMFGYFPSYSLGAIMAAQWFAKLESDMPKALENVARGDFAPIMGWLKTNIHSQASLLLPGDLLQKVTGKPLDSASYKKYLQGKYGA